MLYGHIESIEDRVDHLVRLREQQDKSGGFQCFIPLAFYPENTQLSHLPGPSGVDSLKTMAVSRLMLDNFDHIKAYWVMLGNTWPRSLCTLARTILTARSPKAAS